MGVHSSEKQYAPHELLTSNPRLDLLGHVIFWLWIIDGIVPPGEALAEIPAFRRRDIGAVYLGPAIKEGAPRRRNLLLLFHGLCEEGFGLGQSGVDGGAGDPVVGDVEEPRVLGRFAYDGGEGLAGGEVTIYAGDVDDGDFGWVAVSWWCLEDISIDRPVSTSEFEFVRARGWACFCHGRHIPSLNPIGFRLDRQHLSIIEASRRVVSAHLYYESSLMRGSRAGRAGLSSKARRTSGSTLL